MGAYFDLVFDVIPDLSGRVYPAPKVVKPLPTHLLTGSSAFTYSALCLFHQHLRPLSSRFASSRRFACEIGRR